MSVGKFLNIAYNVTSHFVESIPKKERKKYGQFFTSKKTAEFMASLFTIDYSKPELRLLDAGAGTGLLTTALVERLRDSGYNGRIMAVCYENDLKVLPTLTVNLENLKNYLNVKYEIRIENYLTSQNFLSADLFKKDTEEYDMIIGNPPYLKIAKDAPEALAMPEVCYGAPNLYFLFWAMGIKNLKKGEEMVYIIPRSWTSGAYFERFRKFLFQHCVIINIHIFGSRDKVFDGESVLQETIIIKIRKTNEKPRFVKMSSSETSDFEGIRSYDVDYNTIVAPNQFVFSEAISFFKSKVQPRKIARKAAETALLMLTAKECPSGKMPVVIGNGWGGVLFHEACGHPLEASAVSKGLSCFSGKEGEMIASPIVTAVDDSTIPNGWGSIDIDDEGNLGTKRVLIKDGKLVNFMIDDFNGRRMNREGNGSCRRQNYKFCPTSRMSNTYIANGKSKPEDIIKATKLGLYAVSFNGGSVDPTTGEFNFGCSEAYIIRDGKIAEPVKGATSIGKGEEILKKIDMIGNDLALAQGMCGAASGSIRTNVGQPTLRISEILVGGRGGELK